MINRVHAAVVAETSEELCWEALSRLEMSEGPGNGQEEGPETGGHGPLMAFRSVYDTRGLGSSGEKSAPGCDMER